MLGPNQPVILSLLEIEEMLPKLKVGLIFLFHSVLRWKNCTPNDLKRVLMK
jgi:hypothetical protein